MIKANYHTHLIYCNHAVGHAKDYIEEAIHNHFVEIGITDHAPVLECFMSRADYEKNWCYQPMKLDTMYQYYLKELSSAKKDYQDKIKVLSGFETEYLPQSEFFIKKLRSKVDYLNLGVHFFYYQGRVLNSYDDIDYETIDGYLEACIAGMKSGLYNTLVHPDLFMFGYRDKTGVKRFDEKCQSVSRKIIEASIENQVYLEINANGIRNTSLFSNDKNWLYPNRNFWEIVKDYPNVKIIIGADAHDPKHLANENVKLACEFAEELGLRVDERMVILH